jgi:hypothetical protein
MKSSRKSNIFLFSLLYLTTFFNAHFTCANNNSVHYNTLYSFNSTSYLGSPEKSTGNIFKFNAINATPNFDTQLTFSIKGNSFNFDKSYIQYNKGIFTLGFGSKDRNWSFSPNTSLILSSNARPTKAIYLSINNKPGNKISFETFNGITKNSLNQKDSLLLGSRLVLSPIENLKFELIQTSQWAGSGYKNDFRSLFAAIITDSNEGKNSNINKMAGFGISYTLPIKEMPIRIYSQAVGEDEAGSLPSCYMYLAGIEWQTSNNLSPKKIGLEMVDTRIEKTEHGFCGANTAYNNGIYDYTNYGTVLGAPIDTEGQSIEIYGNVRILYKYRIKASLKKAIINDKNWTDHRLSSRRVAGLIKYVEVSREKGKILFTSRVYHQDIDLDKMYYKNKVGFGFTVSSTF